MEQTLSSGKPAAGAPGRIGYIDAMKGFAILCMIVGHVIISNIALNLFVESTTVFNALYNLIYAFHMPLFMMIGGYVYRNAYVRDGIPDKKRIYRQALNMAVVYLLFSVLFLAPKLLINAVAPGFLPNSASLRDLLLLWAVPYGGYWYIYTLPPLYLFFSIGAVYRVNEYVMFAVLLAVALVSQLFSFPYFQVNRILYYAFFFYVGTLYHRNKLIRNKIVLAVALCLSVVSAILFWDTTDSIEHGLCSIFGIGIVVAFGICGAVWYLFEHVKIIGENRLLRLLGRHSLEIYLLSAFLMTLLGRIGIRLGITHVAANFLFQTVLGLALPILFSFVCRKLRIDGLLFKPVTYFYRRRMTEKAADGETAAQTSPHT